MDGSAFDHLVQTLATASTRRRLLAMVSSLPLAGLGTSRDVDLTAAASRHHRRQKHQDPQSGDDRDADVTAAAGRRHRRRARHRHDPGQDKGKHQGNGKGNGKGKGKGKETGTTPGCADGTAVC